MEKSGQELTPQEILMLSYLEKYAAGTEPARFWSQKYNVEDVPEMIASLEQRGYASGGKLTAKGREMIAENEYVLYIHQHNAQDITLDTMAKLVAANPGRSYRDIMWAEYNRLCGEYIRQGQLGLYRNVRYTMSQFLREEGRYKDALAMLSEVVYYDINWDSSPIMPKGIVRGIKELSKQCAMSENDMIDMLTDRLTGLPPMHDRCSVKETVCIIVAYATGHDDIATKLIPSGK